MKTYDTFYFVVAFFCDIMKKNPKKGRIMTFFEKLGKVLTNTMVYTIALVGAIILFLYFTGGDLIAGAFTAFFALIIYVCIAFLYKEYKKMPAGASAKKSVKKKK